MLQCAVRRHVRWNLRNLCAGIALVATALPGAFLASCYVGDEHTTWAAMNPDRSAAAIFTEDTSGVGGHIKYRLRIARGEKMRALGEQITHLQPAWNSYGCGVLGIFWLDDSHLEVQLHPHDSDCNGLDFPDRTVDGITITTTRPQSTLKSELMETVHPGPVPGTWTPR